MSVLRDHYYKLALEIPDERIQAALRLISELSAADDKTEYEYALGRLTKGLATPRQLARYGFSMALTELVRILVQKDSFNLTVDLFLDRLLAASNAKGLKPLEARPLLYGRLFGLQALLSTGLLVDCPPETLVSFATRLVELALTKNWIRETTLFTYTQFLEGVFDKSFSVDVAARLLQPLNDHGFNLLTEGMAAYLTVPEEHRAAVAKSIREPKANWQLGDPLATPNKAVATRVLRDVDTADAESKVTAKQWLPRLPFVWDVILRHYLEADTDSRKGRKRSRSPKVETGTDRISLSSLWRAAVDELLLTPSSLAARKFWGVSLFTQLVQRLEHPEQFFTPNLLRVTGQEGEAHLGRAVRSAAQAVVGRLQSEPEKTSTFLDSVTNTDFAIYSKSRLMEALVTAPSRLLVDKLTFNTVALAVLAHLMKALSNDVNNLVLRWVLEKFVAFQRSMRHSKHDSSTYTAKMLEVLLDYTFFEDKKVGAFGAIARERLNALLAEVIAKRHEGRLWAYYCVKYIENQQRPLALELSDELEEVKAAALKTLAEMHGTDEALFLFQLLMLMLLLELYHGEGEAVSVLEELEVCYRELAETTSEDSALVMTEILLLFASRQSALLKKLVLVVWESLLCAEDANGELRVNPECFKALFEVLTASESEHGQLELFDEDVDVDVEDEEEEVEEDGDDENDLEQQTKIKLAEALGIPTDTSGEVKFDDISDDNESEEMDDEAMMAMDDELSRIFKERHTALAAGGSRAQRKEKAQARQNMVAFKSRVLDLLELFCTKQPGSALVVAMAQPLAELVCTTSDTVIRDKARRILKAKVTKSKVAAVSDVGLFKEDVLALMRFIHETVHRASTPAAVQVCASANVYLAKSLLLVDLTALEEVMAIYTASMVQWAMDKKDKATAAFFTDFVTWLGSVRPLGKFVGQQEKPTEESGGEESETDTETTVKKVRVRETNARETKRGEDKADMSDEQRETKKAKKEKKKKVKTKKGKGKKQ